MDWKLVDWERIIYTDEASVELGKESSQCLVWRKPGKRYLTECIAPTFRSSRSSVMVWGCIAYNTHGLLVWMPSGRRNGKDYVEFVLDGHLLLGRLCALSNARSYALM